MRIDAAVRTRLWRKANPDKWERQKRTANLKKFGLTCEEYDQMSLKQNDRCAICYEIETERNSVGNIKILAVDHDHTTGKIRGLLCSRCNASIGKFEESPALLRRAAEYIEISR